MGLDPNTVGAAQATNYHDHRLLDREVALARYAKVRGRTLELCAPLSPEDMVIQSMPDVSPTKWHLGHTTWFFETFILGRYAPGYRPFDDRFAYIFNSYYEAEGPRHPRPERGMLSRPALDQVEDYRHHVDAAMTDLIESQDENTWAGIAPLIDLGCQHEEQHQELILTDIKHVLSRNPSFPAYSEVQPALLGTTPKLSWINFQEGVVEIGHGGDGFAFDCEGPRHKIYQTPFQIASRVVTTGEYLKFVDDGGYQRPDLWLSDGWATASREGWQQPLYWYKNDDVWQIFTLTGLRRLHPAEPVCHLSYFEADAFARWAGARLPTEAEREFAEISAKQEATPGEESSEHAADGSENWLAGEVWEWTSSAFAAYPGFRAAAGAIGEYNGKFMCNQFVLKGGSRATPPGHYRSTYRNFFYPHCRWQFTGLRLARDAE